MSVLPKEVLEMFGTKRFYVLFADGTWRTVTDEQWKAEQLWKLRPVKTWWAGGEDELKALELAFARYLDKDLSVKADAA